MWTSNTIYRFKFYTKQYLLPFLKKRLGVLLRLVQIISKLLAMKSTIGHNASSAVSFDPGTTCLYCLQKLLLDDHLVIVISPCWSKGICNTVSLFNLLGMCGIISLDIPQTKFVVCMWWLGGSTQCLQGVSIVLTTFWHCFFLGSVTLGPGRKRGELLHSMRLSRGLWHRGPQLERRGGQETLGRKGMWEGAYMSSWCCSPAQGGESLIQRALRGHSSLGS